MNRRPAMAGILCGLFLSAMDSTIVLSALPTIVSDFNHLELYFLPVSIAMIVSTISVTVAGRLSDLYGRRRFHTIGVLCFLGGSILCSLAPTMGWLIAFRALQAVGQGAIMTLSYTMIGDLYPLEERGRIQGSIGGIWGLAALIGPVLGGWITSNFGWRPVFLATLPLGLLSLIILRRGWVDPPRRDRVALPDIPGAGLLALASASLLVAFAIVRHPRIPWHSPWVLGLLGGAAVFGILLAVVERRSKDPFMAVDLFRNRLFWTGTVCSSLLAATMFCAFAYLTLFAQSVVGSSPMMAGMVLTPMMFAWVACSATGGILVLRLGYRKLAVAGSLLAAVSYYLLSRMGVGTTWIQVAGAATILGAGLGFVLTPLLIAAQNSVPAGRLGAATSLTQFCRSMTGAIGIAVAGAIMATILAGSGVNPDDIVNPELRKRIPPETAESLRGVIADALRPVFRFGLGAAALAFLASWLLPAGRARDLRSAEATRTAGSPR
jgi:EmrB/QacA subfamily drug resistance transporter